MAAYKVKCPVCKNWKRNTDKRKLDKGFGACQCNSIDYGGHKKVKLKEEDCTELGPKEKISFVIKGNPKIKKNSQRIVMNGIRPSIAYELWAGQAMFQIQEMMELMPRQPIKGPVWMEAHYYRESKVKADLSNLHEGIQDCLSAMGFWLDDSIIESHDGSRKHYDKDNPRIEIIIRRYEEE